MTINQITWGEDRLALGRKRISGLASATSPLDFFRSLLQSFRRQDDYKYLLGLPDYLLADIGVTRAQVLAEMQGGRV